MISGSNGAATRLAPPASCQRCPRLAAFREANRAQNGHWHNDSVPSFGASDARLLVVGLAPGLRGANRTGRPFTGDYAGDLLFPTLQRHGFATGDYRREADDGLILSNCRITNAVRCVPPENKPTGVEVRNCRDYLAAELLSPHGRRPDVIMPLGGIAHGSVLQALGLGASRYPFVHGAVYRPPDLPVLVPSYHCSRYNVNTGRLTPAMFDEVVSGIRALLHSYPEGHSSCAGAPAK